MILVDLKDSPLDNLKNWNIKMFPEITTLNSFWGKMSPKQKIFYYVSTKSKKDEDYM